MKKTLLPLILTLMSMALFAGPDLRWVAANEAGSGMSRVEIDLSGNTAYSMKADPSRTVLRVRVQNVGNMPANPVVPGQTKLVESIKVSREGADAIIEIHATEPIHYEYRLYQKRLLINLANREKLPIPGPSRRYRSSRKALPPEPEPLIESAPDSVLARDSLYADTIRVAPIVLPPVASGSDPFFRLLVVHRNLTILILSTLIILLICIRIIRRLSRRNLPRKELESDDSALPLESETGKRMVMALAKEGWNAREISRELNLPLRDVQRIIARGLSADND